MKPVRIIIGTDEDFKNNEGVQIYAEAKDEGEILKILGQAKSLYELYKKNNTK